MYRFNENNIVTGYIKEFLSSFNLPTCPVYRDRMRIYSDKNYLYEDKLIKTKSGLPTGTTTLINNYTYVQPYTYGLAITNITHTYQPRSLLYDTDTHEYLGEYLRFLRDYTGVNLMMLYNCFSNNLLTNLHYHVFDTDDTDYKIYAIPVKFNKSYLIGIDSAQPVYLCCGLYKNVLLSNVNVGTLYARTYQAKQQISFTEPSLFSTYVEDSELLNDYESCLKLFIKLPVHSNSSISIIEAGIVNESKIVPEVYKQNQYGKVANVIIPNTNLTTYLPTHLSLLKLNDGISYPFADRLIEFLFENAVTKNDSISENIERVQKQLLNTAQYTKNGARLKTLGHYGVWNDYIKTTCYNACTNRVILKDSQTSKSKRFIDMNVDITGYIDKDVEKLITVIPEEEF